MSLSLPPGPDEPSSPETTFSYLHAVTQGRVIAHISHVKFSEPAPLPPGNWLWFLGTGGNPVNVVTQVQPTGGFLLRMDGTLVHFDPGPGALVHAARAGLDLRNLDAVYVSHDHTDHAADAGGVVEAMTHLMSRRKGVLLAGPVSLGPEGMISRFHQGVSDEHEGYREGPAQVVALSAGRAVGIGNLSVVPVPAYHSRDNFGCVVSGGALTVGYTSDTGYIRSYVSRDGQVKSVDYRALHDFEAVAAYHHDVKEAYQNVNVLVANTSYFNMFANRQLTVLGLIHLLEGSTVKLAVITHLDACYSQPTDVRHHLARYVEEKTGVRTVLASEQAPLALDGLV
ncbi:MAG: MBL fold metallo-hydrolase [Bacillota bacterium]